MNVDDNLEDIRWIRGLGGERLPAASYALLPNLKKKNSILAMREGSRFFSFYFLHISAQMCFYQTPGRRPTRITGRVVNTATRGWVGAPNDHAPFRLHDAIVGFVDRCVSRTRILAASKLSFSPADLGPTSAQEFSFSFFVQLWKLFGTICAHSERCRHLMAGIFEIHLFFGIIAFPLASVYLEVKRGCDSGGVSGQPPKELPILTLV